MSLTDEQVATLLRPINPRRVLQSQGQSHLPAFDVEAHLSRIFGFENWDREILDLWLISESLEHFTDKKTNQEKQGWTVTYGCKLRLTVYARDPLVSRSKDNMIVYREKTVRDGAATGSANHLPLKGDAHDFAMKNADSYALKRAAKSWGDQFGLSLYNKGMTAALVGRVVGFDKSAGHLAQSDEHVPEPQSKGNDERQEEPPVEDESRTFAGATGLASQQQIRMLRGLLADSTWKITDNDQVHQWVSDVLLIQCESLKLLTSAQMSKCIERAQKGPA